MLGGRDLIYKNSKALSILTVVLFSIALAACTPDAPVEDLNKTLSGNSLYSRSGSYEPQYVWFFGTDGKLNVLGQSYNEGKVFQGTWRIVGSEDTNAVFAEGLWHSLTGDGRRVSRQESMLYEVARGENKNTFVYASSNYLSFRNRKGEVFDLESSSYNNFIVDFPSSMERGFSQRSEYNALVRKILSAEAYKAPEPEPAGKILAEAAIMLPLCILSAFLLCI